MDGKVYNAESNSYNLTIKGIKHDESLAVIDKTSGEVREIKTKEPRQTNDSDKAPSIELFQKCYTNAWKLLLTQLNDKEFVVAYKLGVMAKAYTNSIEPLNDDTTAIDLSETLGVDRRYVHKIIDKLFKLGVIAKFECYNGRMHSKYWIFNPYLMFNGKLIQKDIPTLFSDTVYAKL